MGEGGENGGGIMSGDSYSERSSMARLRANSNRRKAQAKLSGGLSQQLPCPQRGSNSVPPPPPQAIAAPVSSHKTNQDKALIKILGEMRDLEKKMNAQSVEYETERQQFQDTIAQHKQEIESLQQSNEQLAEAKHQAEHTLRMVFIQLGRFSTGCWQFPSNSVKKMSEALHVQLQEWKRNINESLSTEDEFLEKSAMEKMQAMHLEVAQLRAENSALKKQTKGMNANNQSTNRSTRSGLPVTGEDDESTLLSGMTSTILSEMTESPRMKDSMKAFLQSPTKPKKTDCPSSILKQSSRWNEDNERRNGASQQQRSKSSPAKPPRIPQNYMMSSSKKGTRFASVDDEFDCDWGDEKSEV